MRTGEPVWSSRVMHADHSASGDAASQHSASGVDVLGAAPRCLADVEAELKALSDELVSLNRARSGARVLVFVYNSSER